MTKSHRFKSTHVPLVGMAALSMMTPIMGEEGLEIRLPEILVTDRRETTYPSRLSLTRYLRPIALTPQSTTLITGETMAQQNVSTMRDALRNVAGISLAAGEGGVGQGDNLTLRGFSAKNDVFLDGMRDGGNYYRDAFNWERVEVLKGASSVAFGRGSTGGVVQQVSKAPHSKEVGSVSMGLSSAHRERLTLDYNMPLTESTDAIRVNMVQDAGSVAGRNVVNTNRWGVATSLALGMGTPTRFTLSHLATVARDVPDFGVPWLFNAPAPVPRHLYYGFSDDFFNTNADVVTATLAHDIHDTLQVRNQFRYAHYRRQLRATKGGDISTTLGTPLQDMMVTRTMVNRDSTETMIDHQLDVITSFNTGSVSHDVSMGIELIKETSTPIVATITAPSTPLLTPNNGAFNGTYAAPSRTVVQVDTLSLYALDTVSLSPQWEITGGLRWDSIRSHFSKESTHLSSLDSVMSARGALTYLIDSTQSVYVSYGSSFNPSADALGLTAGNTSLSPEQNQTIELGSKWSLWNQALVIRGALFSTDKLNAREINPNNANEVVLAGHQRVDGIEIEGNARITPQWQVNWGYAHMKSQLMSSRYFPAAVGGPLANVPLNTFSAWSTYQLPWKIEVGAGIQYVDSRRASSTSSTHDPTTGLPKEVPAYCLFNAMVSIPFSDKISTQLNVYNLFDLVYYDQVYPSHVVPGEGRSITVTVKVNW